MSAAWAIEQPETLASMLDDATGAGAVSTSPRMPKIAEIFSDDRYLNLKPSLIRAALPSATGGPTAHIDRSVFFAGAANFPWRSHAAWFAREMKRWNLLDGGVDLHAAAAIYRPDLFLAAATRTRYRGAARRCEGRGRPCRSLERSRSTLSHRDGAGFVLRRKDFRTVTNTIRQNARQRDARITLLKIAAHRFALRLF